MPINKLVFQGDQTNFLHKGQGGFDCKCASCKEAAKPQDRFVSKVIVNPIEEIIKNSKEPVRQRSFNWFLEHLLPSMPDKFKGCELIFPDTLIFCKGKSKLVIKCDKDWCLTSVKAAKVPLGKICTEF